MPFDAALATVAAELAILYAEERETAKRGIHPADPKMFRHLAGLVTLPSPYQERALSCLAYLFTSKYDGKTQAEHPDAFERLTPFRGAGFSQDDRAWANSINVVYYPEPDSEIVAISPCEQPHVRAEVAAFCATKGPALYGPAYFIPTSALQMLVARLLGRDTPLVFEPRIARGIERRRERRIEGVGMLTAVPVWTHDQRVYVRPPADRAIIDVLKAIPNYAYNSQLRVWSVPVVQARVLKEALEKAGANIAGFTFVQMPEESKLPFEVREHDEALHLRFRYDDYLVAGIRDLPGARYDPQGDAWVLPRMEARTLLRVLARFPAYDDTQVAAIIEKLPPLAAETIRPADQVFLDHARNYQVIGSEFLAQPLTPLREEYGQGVRGFIIGDDCGLGKTMQLAEASRRTCAEDLPIVVLTTKSGRLSWKAELHKWLKLTDEDMWMPRTGKETIPDKPWMILSIGLLGVYAERLREMGISVLIVDEAHLFKNPKSKRNKLLVGYQTRAIKRGGKQIPAQSVSGVVSAVRQRVMVASGTLIANRLADTFAYWQLVGHPLGQSFYRFAQRYCMPEDTPWGTQYTGASNVEELRKAVAPFFIQRLKGDVASELPPKIRVVVPVECDHLQDYREALKEFKEQPSRARGTILEFIQRALTDVAFAKVKDGIEFVETRLEAGERVLLYAGSTRLLDMYEEHFGDNLVRIDGSRTDTQRKEALRRFQDREVPLFLGQWEAAGESVTLTAATHVVFAEIPWNPKTFKQVEDRAHRLGQTETVTISYLTGVNTVDEHVVSNVLGKLDVINTFEQTTDLSMKRLAELFRDYLLEPDKAAAQAL